MSTFSVWRAGLGAGSGTSTLIQRFGPKLNLNVHRHILSVDDI